MISFCQGRDMVLPATWRRRPTRNMVTFRAPGTDCAPGPDPDPSKFAELDVIIAPRRWDSVVEKVHSDVRSPLNSDHFPVLVNLRVKIAAPQKEAQATARIKAVTEADKENYARELDHRTGTL
eukprot:6148661-Alexandrium_andersonii.AAC.1